MSAAGGGVLVAFGDALGEAWQDWLASRARVPSAAELAERALVFAPHPDDETLGCGGTIRSMREVGTSIHIAFMTDGAASHSGQISAQALRRQRRKEALAASAQLGIERGAARFFEFPDGRLRDFQETATERALALLQEVRPRAVFVPHRLDGPEDHRVTHRVALEAVQRTARRTVVWEYPVWLWNHFPWVRWDRARSTRRQLAEGLRSQRAFFEELRYVVSVERALESKRRAILCYTSQIQRPHGAVAWPVLGDVAEGDFLRRLCGKYEFFSRYEA